MKIELKSQEKYRNIKNNNIYIFLREIVDATNSREGNTVALYIDAISLKLYVRDTDEFLEKFVKI